MPARRPTTGTTTSGTRGNPTGSSGSSGGGGFGFSGSGAAQGASLGAAGFAAGPGVGLITTGAGALIGGLFGGGKKPQPVSAGPGYYVDPSTGAIGGVETKNYYAQADELSPDQLLDWAAGAYGSEGTQSPESQAALNAWLQRRAEIGMQGGDITQANSGPEYDALVNALRQEAATEQIAIGSYDESRGQQMGLADIDAGNALLEKGLNLPNRASVKLGPVDQAAADAARSGVKRLQKQAGADYARGNTMLDADRARMSDQLMSDLARAEGQYGQGQGQLSYLDRVQRGQAGPSLAELQSQRMLGEQVASQAALAKSGSSFSPGAMRAATISGQQMADAQRQQVAELRAAEQARARDQYGALLGQQQAGAQGLAGLGLSGTQAIGALGQQGVSNLAGITQAQQGAALNLYGQDIGRVGQEMGYATTQAQLADAQRARDDARRLGMSGLGVDVRGQGYGVLQGEAANRLTAESINAGAQGLASGQALQAGQFNSQQDAENRAANRAMTYNALGTALSSGATAYAASQANKPPEVTGTPTPGAYESSKAVSDERTKTSLRSAESEIDRLTEQLARQQAPAVSSGEADSSLRALAGMQAPSWEYTPEARAAYPDATGPGRRIGYTTQQLRRAGPAGRSMVSTRPDGTEQVDVPAATTFGLAAIGQQQRELDRLDREVSRLRRQGGAQ